MFNRHSLLFLALLIVAPIDISLAGDPAPWGRATTLQPEYRSQKVVYDVDAASEAHLSNIISRTGYLSKLNGNDPFDNKIVVVIHGDAIPFFSIARTEQYRQLMELAYSQSLGGSIEFRMCQASARLRGLKPEDIHGFVTMVPMADAEIVRLQQAGYAYMR